MTQYASIIYSTDVDWTAPEHAAELLAGITTDDEVGRPGTGPVAVGALPFDPAAPGRLTIPARVMGRDARGRGWITHIGPPLEPVPAPAPRARAIAPIATPAGRTNAPC